MPTPEEEASIDYPSSIMKQIISLERLKIRSGKGLTMAWFIFINLSICLSIAFISAGALLQVVPFVFAVVFICPLFSLWSSRWRAKRAYSLYMINPAEFQQKEEEYLFQLVKALSQKAGMKHIPQIGIYQSSEINAFAVGASRKRSLIAFSSKLLEEMDEQALAAVAAHEISHIANGDMLTMTLLQSAINTVIFLCIIPLKLIEWFIGWLSQQGGRWVYWLASAVRFLVISTLALVGNLIVKSFSRRREYKADKLAARLVDREAMIHALQLLGMEQVVNDRRQKAFASFRIHAPGRFIPLFSTHPSIKKRIQALTRLKL